MMLDRGRRAHLYARYIRASDPVLMVLALLMIPVLLGPMVFELPPDQDAVLDMLDWTIYGIFAADFLVRLVLAPSLREHLRRNWLDAVVLALPLLRAFRILNSVRLLRLLRLTRLATFWGSVLTRLARIMVRRGFHGVALVVVLVIMLSAALMAFFERESEGSIKSFGDAVWWAITTVTTVGYGDAFPITPEGRGVAIFLMIAGIVFYGILTANLAAYFVESDEASEGKKLNAKLDDMAARLERIETALATHGHAKKESDVA
jgi:voltage-gated potassium channel